MHWVERLRSQARSGRSGRWRCARSRRYVVKPLRGTPPKRHVGRSSRRTSPLGAFLSFERVPATDGCLHPSATFARASRRGKETTEARRLSLRFTESGVHPGGRGFSRCSPGHSFRLRRRGRPRVVSARVWRGCYRSRLARVLSKRRGAVSSARRAKARGVERRTRHMRAAARKCRMSGQNSAVQRGGRLGAGEPVRRRRASVDPVRLC